MCNCIKNWQDIDSNKKIMTEFVERKATKFKGATITNIEVQNQKFMLDGSPNQVYGEVAITHDKSKKPLKAMVNFNFCPWCGEAYRKKEEKPEEKTAVSWGKSERE